MARGLGPRLLEKCCCFGYRCAGFVYRSGLSYEACSGDDSRLFLKLTGLFEKENVDSVSRAPIRENSKVAYLGWFPDVEKTKCQI